MTTYTKKFKEFIPEWNPESDDYIVGYRNLDDSEIRIPLLAVDNSITANKYIRKDIDDYANGIIRFNKGFTVSNKVMSTIYLQGLDGWMGTQKGDFEMNSLILREFLEVPELRKNKITVMGNQFWFTDSAMVKVANATGSDNYDIYFKLEDEEYAPFELNDIIKGIYHYDNGFWTVYLKVYELIVNPDTGGEIGVKAHSMNGRDPRQSMLLARMNNSDNPERQGSIFADGLRKYIRVLDGYNPDDPTSEGSIKTLKVQIGDLSTITNHPIFGDLEGYGLYADNVYLTGKLIVKNDPNQPGQELGVYRGVWNNQANYYKYDQVTYKGSLFTSKQIDNIGHIPTGNVDDLWWELTVAKGEDGTSAESNIIIELTNDNHNIPTDSEGKNPSYGGAYCTAYVFQGTNDITDLYTISATVEAPVTSQQLQIVQNDNTVTITHISDDIDAAAIKFTATAVGYPTVTRTWNVAKVKSGTPGEPATAYWIVTDSPVIKKYVFNVNDSEVIRYEPSPFVVRAFAQTGQENIRQFDGYFRIKYGTQVNIIAGSVYQFTPQADVDNYTIEFFLEQGLYTLLDKEIITVVEDGKDGDTPDWNIFIFKKGPEQPSAPTFTTPPSSYPSDGWYDYPTSDGIWWMSTAVVNGNSKTIAAWSVPVKTTGEDGLNGADGGYVDFKYAVSTSHNTPPSIVKTDRQPDGWSDVPPTVTSGLFLWMVNAFINPDNTLNGVWSDPMRISGETGPEGPRGPQGLHGNDGLQGPSITFGGNWSSTTQYYGYVDTQTCVYYGGKYYYTKTVSPDLSPLTIPSGATNNPASANGKVYWNEFVGQFDNIATGLLLAERIATSELTANKLFIVDRQESTGNIIAADGSIITKEEEKNLDPNQIIGRLTKGWYLDQGVIRSIAVNSDNTPKLILDKDGKITATGVNVTGTVHFENGTIGSLQVFNDSAWTATVNGPYPASSGFYYLRKNQGVTVTPQGHIIGKDYFLTGDSTVGPSVFVGDVYVPGSSVPGTNDSTLTSFLKLFNSLFERVLVNSQYHIKAKLPLFSVGEITAYGDDNMDIPSIWDSIPVDKVTIDLVNGKLTVIGGTGGIKGISLPSMTAEDALVGASLNAAGDVITFTKGTFATKAYVTWGNITNKPSTFAPSSHTHNYASTVIVGSTSYNINENTISLPAYPTVPSALKNPNALTISLNGTSQGAYDGSAAKSINITAASVGAAASSHTHSYLPLSGGTLSGNLFIPNNAAIIQNQASTSNYTTAIKWYKGGVSQNVYDPQIGQYNQGGTGSGSITILPYSTSTGPWNGTVGLFLTEATIAFNNNSIYHSGNFTNLNQLTTRNFSDLQNKPTTLAGYGITDALLASTYTASDVLNKIKTVDGSGSGLDADLLDGMHLRSIIGFDTKRDFINGTLITTDIDYSVTNGESFYLEIKGNTYNRRYPCLTQAQGYIWYNTIINYGVTHLSYVGIFGLIALNVNGRLCFWFPRQGYWEGYSIFVSSAHSTSYNRVIAIDDVAKPAGTKEVIISEHTSTSAFLDSNVESATKLQTARTIWGQSFNGGADVSGDMTGVGSITMSGRITNTGGLSARIGSTASWDNATIFSAGTYPLALYYPSGTANTRRYYYSGSANALTFSSANDANSWVSSIATYYHNGTVTWHGTATFRGNVNVTGNVVASGEVTAYSDIRLKSNIDTLPYRGRLSPKTYIKDGKQSIGFIAQEVQELYPELVLVGEDDNHYLSLNYGSITAVLASQLNLVEDEVTVLKRKVLELEQEIKTLKNK